MTFDQLIVQQRPCIERLVHGIARRYYLASSDIQDFLAAVDRSLERNDYELLRAFDGLIVPVLRWVESRWRPPFGQSLFAVARKRPAAGTVS